MNSIVAHTTQRWKYQLPVYGKVSKNFGIHCHKDIEVIQVKFFIDVLIDETIHSYVLCCWIGLALQYLSHRYIVGRYDIKQVVFLLLK